MKNDNLEHLLSLDDIKYVIDDDLGLWVKFEAKCIAVSKLRPQGVKYALTLHNRSGKRLMGFDNAHAIE